MESTQQKGPGFYEFLVEAELQHYYTSIKSDLKIQNTSQLKYVTDDDLYQLGMSKPEVRRLKKYFNKYFPQNYLSKFKKMLLPPKKDEQVPGLAPSIYDPLEPQLGPRVPNKHIISAENIVVNKELGMGEFGVVQQGVWTNDGDRIQVAIKCLSRERMQSNPIEFLKEAAIMHSIDHEHVVRLYGVVLHTDSLMLVTELAPLRSLLECLKEPSLRSSFPVLTLCDFALQICDGMQYLEAKRLIHRDLAARNILVFSKNKVKISDFGLSRALGQGKDYYQTNFNVHLKLPIAWCAPECISYLRFTSASDVWAYGVTLWEMFSYGFQPWAALTGHQILEAIDEPNYQRLDQPECCPKDYFSIMLRCWAHEPNKRPTFSELIGIIPECRPEQLQAIMNTPPELADPKREFLQYKIGDVITVLDKGTTTNLWKGILPNGKSGLFNPAHTVAYIGTNLPTSNKPEIFPKYGSTRRKLRTEMISSPQGEVKHTGHVGLDGAYFGDLSFLGGSSSDEKQTTQYNHLPRQIVTPYRPHEDLDPLLEPASTNLHASDHISSRQLQHLTSSWEEPHEYHEISDEENLVSPRFEKSFDFGPSLLDEMETMFRNMNSPDHDGVNKCNELRELTSRLGNTNITRPKKQATVKPISAHDQKILDSAIELATEMTARSLNNLDGEPLPPTPASPNKRKFSFRFPNTEVDGSKTERRNFSDEAQSIPDLQSTLTEEAQLAYESLIETQRINPLRMLRAGNLPRIRSVRRRDQPEDDVRHSSVSDESNCGDPPSYSEFENPIPLPPRDRTKPALSKPRHTRKHPLIIPAGRIQQRTLSFAGNPVKIIPEPSYINSDFEARIDSDLEALDNIDTVDGVVKASEKVIDLDAEGELRHDKDHVSCEDLLKFADSRPSSKQRGVESDEVRIMEKVLGNEVTSQQCLLSLEHSNWDVHKAIKLTRLQNLLKTSVPFVDLATCNGALEANQWDLTKAANWIVAANQDGDITQV